MPARNIVKTYYENGYYHVYNRGVEKREVFIDEYDCNVFLHYLKLYLSPIRDIQVMQITQSEKVSRFLPLNLSTEVDLLAFSLMPNHFHLLLKQYSMDGITKLMKRLMTGYVMFFNRKYRRVGGLFQNTYKAANIDSDSYLLHLSRYIHLNPTKIDNKMFENYSSYHYFLRLKHANWIKPDEIIAHFSKDNKSLSYQDFVEDQTQNSEEILQDLMLEFD